MRVGGLVPAPVDCAAGSARQSHWAGTLPGGRGDYLQLSVGRFIGGQYRAGRYHICGAGYIHPYGCRGEEQPGSVFEKT